MSFKKKLIKYSEHLYTFHPGKLTHLLYLAFSHTHTIYFFFLQNHLKVSCILTLLP